MHNKPLVYDVTYGIKPINHDSFTGAIDASNNANEDEDVLNKKSLVDGKIVSSYLFSGDAVCLSLSNGRVLKISAGSNKIIWDVLSAVPSLETAVDGSEVKLRYPSGILYDWDWKCHFDAIRGKQIKLSLSEQMLFLFVKDEKDYYCISYVKCSVDPIRKFLTIGFV